MKHPFFLILLTQLLWQGAAAQVSAPSLSPKMEFTQRVGLTDISISYSRPGMRGRTVFGPEGLVRYMELWRTGANAATKISVSDDVTINDQHLPKGEYALLSMLTADSWTLYFHPYDTGSWGRYRKRDPALTVTAPTQQLAYLTEDFFIGFEGMSWQGAELVLRWANTESRFKVGVDVASKMDAQITKTMNGPSKNDYFQAAVYLHESGRDLDTALEYIQKVTESEKALFFQVHREALILADLGRKAEATAAAERSRMLSEKAGNMDFVRLNEQLLARLQ
ncbi:MAG: DUF2911 domain-containing protein [Bacteroidota bacterium]